MAARAGAGGFTLRELHGVIQVAMGWEGIHLYDFHLRAARYGSSEVAASSPDVTLAALRFRKGARFVDQDDLNIPWRHEVRIEDRLELEARKTYPVCTGGDGACPPENCGGPESFMARRDDWFSLDALEDLDTMVEVLQQVALKDGSGGARARQETRRRLEDALERGRRGSRPRGGRFRGGKSTRVFAMVTPQPHAPAVVTRSARRCANNSAASRAASSPRCRRMPAIRSWAAGSVSASNRRCNVAAVVSA